MDGQRLKRLQAEGQKVYVITTWGACLELLDMYNVGFNVKAPRTIDAGQTISNREVILIARRKPDSNWPCEECGEGYILPKGFTQPNGQQKYECNNCGNEISFP